MSHAFIDNSFAIHITYNWNNNIIEYEKEFCNIYLTNNSYFIGLKK